jgi:glyoxylase-like metal-dependent hydrolase (beta-lactamase superfamily II)
VRQLYLAGAALIATAAIAADSSETYLERSQARARAVLDRAVDALGGATTLRGIEAVRMRLTGETWPRLQAPTAAPPFETGTQDETVVVDFKNSTMIRDLRTTGAGFEGDGTVVIRAGSGMAYDHRARTATPIPAGQSSQQQFTQYYRRLPNLLLVQALNNTNSLRHLGEDTFEGRRHDVITFVMADTQQVAVYVDQKSALVSKYELIFVDGVEGEESSEILFGDYVALGATKVPRMFSLRQVGEFSAKLKVEVEINPPAEARAPAAGLGAGYANVEATPATLPAEVETLADGVYLVRHTAGQNQHTLAVAFADHVLAVEAPGTSPGADAVIAKIKEVIPGKPIRYVAMTHHHGDHIGGLRSYIAEGAAVLTTQGNVGVVNAMAASRQADRLGRTPRKAEVTVIESGRRVLSDGTRTVELIDIGPNPHAREMVIAYLPRERIVFQGDMFGLPDVPAPLGPPQAGTVSFAQKLQQLNLQVDRIAGVHGRTASWDEFQRALQVAPGT